MALAASMASGVAPAQVTERVSVSSSGSEGNGASEHPSLSADGRLVAFHSSASNLVPGDTDGFSDVFVHDRISGTTERVSIGMGGSQPDGPSSLPSISPDGRYVAFQSSASNLVPGDTNALFDVFVRDRASGTTERVSVSTGGAQGNGHSTLELGSSISANGRYVAFVSFASNFFPGDGNGVADVFVRDRASGATEHVSVSMSGGAGDGVNSRPSISASGRHVAFQSWSANLVPGDTNGWMDVFVRDRALGITERVSLTTGGAEANDLSQEPSISASGRYVAFTSLATDLVPGDTNGFIDVFVRDRDSATTERVNLTGGGAQANGSASDPAISADGRYVAFRSHATNLVASDTNLAADVFVRDRIGSTTGRASVATGGAEANDSSAHPSISADGRCVAFHGPASTLVPADANGVDDVFVRDWSLGTITSFCPGDGSGTPCPCGNTGSQGHGCANGDFASGSELSASGTPSVNADGLILAVTASVPLQPGLFFQGDQAVNGGNGLAFGDGLRCAGSNVVRLEIRTADAVGSASTSIAIAAGGSVVAGDVKRYQWWHRDPMGSPCAARFNLSNGLEVTWAP